MRLKGRRRNISVPKLSRDRCAVGALRVAEIKFLLSFTRTVDRRGEFITVVAFLNECQTALSPLGGRGSVGTTYKLRNSGWRDVGACLICFVSVACLDEAIS